MAKRDSPREYDDFAQYYSWLLSDERLTGKPFLERWDKVLALLDRGAKILDCACGIGVDAIALARKGYKVSASDISAGMISEARRRAREAGVRVTSKRSSWKDLPLHFTRPFDAVFCCGNAIGHCSSAKEMVQSLREMRKVLKPGGFLILDSRNWEKISRERVRFGAWGYKRREKRECLILYVWTYGKKWGDPITIEPVLTFREKDELWCKAFSVTYYPFRFKTLVERVQAARFEIIEGDREEEKARYLVIARAIR